LRTHLNIEAIHAPIQAHTSSLYTRRVKWEVLSQVVIPDGRVSVGSGSQAHEREHLYFVYILASQRNGTLYTGVTNDLAERFTTIGKAKSKDS
jgi:hypothetical protein